MKDKTSLDVLLAVGAPAGIIGLAVGVAHGIVQARYGTLRAWAGGLVASMLVGVGVGWGLSDHGFSITTQYAIIVACSYVAGDVLLGLLVLGSLFSSDPAAFVARVIDGVRGRSAPPQPPADGGPQP
jgi:hypothetical protein